MIEMEQDLFFDEKKIKGISNFGEEIVEMKGVRNTADQTPYGRPQYTGDPVIDAIEAAIAEGDDVKAARLLQEWGKSTE